MKRIAFSSLAGLTLLTALATQGMAQTPNPNSAVIKTRIFNDCPFSRVTVVNNYPALISIQDDSVACSGFANLHNWTFSTDGTTGAQFPNSSDFSVSTDLVLDGTGTRGEAGLRVSPWYGQDTDGRFNIKIDPSDPAHDGEIACFGGRLPFFSFTTAYGLHYVKGTPIHLAITVKPHAVNSASPLTFQYDLTYQGNSYTSGQLRVDSGNPNEDPPHGLWGLLNFAEVGGYFQPRLDLGNFNNKLKATFTNIRFVICPKVEPAQAVFNPRVFNDCPPTALTIVPNYPSEISFTEAGLACSGFANMDVWTLADGAGNELAFDNGDDFHMEMDYQMTGHGEGGIRVSPWWSHYADGLFNVKIDPNDPVHDGEIACFGGRLPFYSFTAQFGIRYTSGNPIHLGVTYKHNGLSAAGPATMQYDVVYQGVSYTSGPLNFDQANPNENPPHGLFGMLNDARVGGHMKGFMSPGDFNATTVAHFTNIVYSSGTTASVAVSPGSLNLKSNGNFVTAALTPSAGFNLADFDGGSLRMNGVAAGENPQIEQGALVVKFSRQALQSAIQNDNGVVTVTGDIADVCFTATTQFTKISMSGPAAGSVVASGEHRLIQWQVPSNLAGEPVDIYSSVDGGENWSQIASGVPNSGSYDWAVPGDISSDDAQVAVQTSDDAAIGISGSFTISASPVGVGDGPLSVEFALKGITPNPASSERGVNVAFSLPSAKQASLSLYDVSGRRVAFREVGSMGPGHHLVNIAQRLPAGVYVVRLSQDGRNLSARASVIR
jgi:hypothetical protein